MIDMDQITVRIRVKDILEASKIGGLKEGITPISFDIGGVRPTQVGDWHIETKTNVFNVTPSYFEKHYEVIP